MAARAAAAAAIAAALLAPAAAQAVVVNPGDILVVGRSDFTTGVVVRVDPDTGEQGLVSSGANFDRPSGIALAPDGRILIADTGGSDRSGAVIAVDPTYQGLCSACNQTVISSNAISGPDLFSDPYGITVDAAGRILVADFSAGADRTGAVIEVDPATGEQRMISSNALSLEDYLSSPLGLTVGGGGRIFVADTFGQDGRDGSVIEIEPANGEQRLVAASPFNERDGLVDPSGITTGAPGQLLIADEGSQADGSGAVIAVTLTGAVSLVSTNAISGPDHFRDPSGIALDGRGRILVADRSAGPESRGAVIAVAPGSGQQSLVSTNEISGPNLLFSPLGLAVVPPAFGSPGAAAPQPGSGDDPRAPAARPRPAAGTREVVEPLRGVVLVRPRGRRRFVRLLGARSIPDGSEIDTTRGVLRLVVAARRGSGRTAAARVSGGRAIVDQNTRAIPTTTLRLSGRLDCRRAGQAASERRRRARSRKLVVRTPGGRFRSRGRYAAASAGGTAWRTTDHCESTRISVMSGRVAVKDLARRRTVVVRAPRRYRALQSAGRR